MCSSFNPKGKEAAKERVTHRGINSAPDFASGTGRLKNPAHPDRSLNWENLSLKIERQEETLVVETQTHPKAESLKPGHRALMDCASWEDAGMRSTKKPRSSAGQWPPRAWEEMLSDPRAGESSHECAHAHSDG